MKIFCSVISGMLADRNIICETLTWKNDSLVSILKFQFFNGLTTEDTESTENILFDIFFVAFVVVLFFLVPMVLHTTFQNGDLNINSRHYRTWSGNPAGFEYPSIALDYPVKLGNDDVIVVVMTILKFVSWENTEGTENILLDIFFVAFVVILFFLVPTFLHAAVRMVELNLESVNSELLFRVSLNGNLNINARHYRTWSGNPAGLEYPTIALDYPVKLGNDDVIVVVMTVLKFVSWENTEGTEIILFDIFFVAFVSFVVVLFFSFPCSEVECIWPGVAMWLSF